MIEPPTTRTELLNGVIADIELPCIVDFVSIDDWSVYDGIEIHPVSWNPKNGDCEACMPGDPNTAMWSVYLHMIPTPTEGGIRCIADFLNEDEAIAFARAICWMKGWEL